MESLDPYFDYVIGRTYSLSLALSCNQPLTLLVVPLTTHRHCPLSFPHLAGRLAPTLFSAIASRLHKSRSHSPQPGTSAAAAAAMGQTPSKKSRKGKDKSKDDVDKDVEGPNDPSDTDVAASADDHDGGNGAQRRATAPNAEPDHGSNATRGASAFTEHTEDGARHHGTTGDGGTTVNGAGPHPPSYVAFPASSVDHLPNTRLHRS